MESGEKNPKASSDIESLSQYLENFNDWKLLEKN